MKLAVINDEVETSGALSTSSFKVKEGAKMFEIVFDRLYSNKVVAVIRELACNAADAHKAANTITTPVDMHLPSIVEPYFYIRDYGTGLSHKDVTGLYVTIFDSTKDTSNDFIGAYGLGSKTPFTLTDIFTVTSYHNGIQRTYSAFRTADRGADISLVSEEPTIEPNGIKVEFPVSSKHNIEFVDNACKYLARLPVSFNWKGVNPHMEPVKYATQTSKYGIRVDKSGNAYGNSSLVVMGGVPYPIDLNQLSGLSYNERQFLSYGGVDLFVPIGTVDINPNRESLSYNSTTQDNLVAFIKEVMLEVSSDAEAKILAAPNFFEACKLYCRLYQFIDDAKQDEILYNGLKVDMQIKLMGNAVAKFSHQYRPRAWGHRKRAPNISYDTPIYYNVTNTPVLVHVDVDKHANQHLFSYMKQCTHDYVMFVKGDIQSVIDQIPGISYVKLSDHPYVHVKQASTRNHVRATDLYQFDGNFYRPKDTFILPTDKDIVWVQVKDKHFVNSDDRLAAVILEEHCKDCIVIGVPKAKWSAAENNPEWHTITDYYADWLAAKTAELQSKAQMLVDYDYMIKNLPLFFSNCLADFDDVENLNIPILKSYYEYRLVYMNYAGLVSSLRFVPTEKPSKFVVEGCKELLDKVPFLSIFSQGTTPHLYGNGGFNVSHIINLFKKGYPNA